ncbi:MAG TPA: type II secretion system F family protein [Myxococcota bacterium]|nr:type II secretion system F family protein [Myxococcota bacterium]HOC98830.1 type II secretion system F family protein [Myxococcota bacterium]HPV04244.1 type II secretion system F family protein [Myxococcota bacterium]
MAKFSWEATSAEGIRKKGVIDAASPDEARKRLRSMNLEPVSVSRSLSSIEITIPRLSGIPMKTLVVFTRQLATMIDAGLPLVQCLDILGTQEPDLEFKKIIMGVKAHVETGGTLADGMKKYPKAFDTLFVSLVQAGEVGGILDTILNRLAAYVEKNQKTKQKVQAALKYPTFVSVAAVVIVGFMLWKIVPQFAGMFKSLGGAELPALTAMVVAASEWFVNHVIIILLIATGAVVGFTLFKKSKFGISFLDKVALRLPVIGDLIRKSAVARFTRTLGTLISSGVPIMEALDVVARSAGNVHIEAAIMHTRAKVAEGHNIAGPLGETKIFPSMVVQMVGVGESTGALDVMLTKIADFYDDEVDVAVDSLTSLMEPLLMIVIGGSVGVVLISMYLPIFGMADNLSRKQ